MRLAITLHVCILLSNAWTARQQEVIPKVVPPDKATKPQEQQDWMSNIRSGAEYAVKGMKQAHAGLNYVVDTAKATPGHLRQVRTAINSYYQDLMDAYGNAIIAFLASVGEGLGDGAVLLSQTMGVLLVNLGETAVNTIWFEDQQIYPSGRRGSTPVFSSVNQYEKAKASGAITPIKVTKVDEDTYQTAAEQEPQMVFIRDPNPQLDPETGVERLVFTSEAKPQQAFIIINLENSGSGYEAIEQESLKKAVDIYASMTTINDKEVLVKITAGEGPTPKSQFVSPPLSVPTVDAPGDQEVKGTKAQRPRKEGKPSSKAPPAESKAKTRITKPVVEQSQKTILRNVRPTKVMKKTPPGLRRKAAKAPNSTKNATKSRSPVQAKKESVAVSKATLSSSKSSALTNDTHGMSQKTDTKTSKKIQRVKKLPAVPKKAR